MPSTSANVIQHLLTAGFLREQVDPRASAWRPLLEHGLARVFFDATYSDWASLLAGAKENISRTTDVLVIDSRHHGNQEAALLFSAFDIGTLPETTVGVGRWSADVKQTLELLDESYKKTVQYAFCMILTDAFSWNRHNYLPSAAEQQQERVLTRFTGKVERVCEASAVVSLKDDLGKESHAVCDLEVLTAKGISEGDWFQCSVIRRAGSTSVEFERVEPAPLSEEELERFYRKVDEELGSEGL